jgi:hypothetical protein
VSCLSLSLLALPFPFPFLSPVPVSFVIASRSSPYYHRSVCRIPPYRPAITFLNGPPPRLVVIRHAQVWRRVWTGEGGRGGVQADDGPSGFARPRVDTLTPSPCSARSSTRLQVVQKYVVWVQVGGQSRYGIGAHAECWSLCSTAYYSSCLPLVPLLIAVDRWHTAWHGLHMLWDHASDRWQREHIISALRSIKCHAISAPAHPVAM